MHSLSIYKERSHKVNHVLQHLPDSAYNVFYWQVTQVSPNLTQFKGYVMKLRLKRKRLYGRTEETCLLFKAKGEARGKYQTITIFMSDKKIS